MLRDLEHERERERLYERERVTEGEGKKSDRLYILLRNAMRISMNITIIY